MLAYADIRGVFPVVRAEKSEIRHNPDAYLLGIYLYFLYAVKTRCLLSLLMYTIIQYKYYSIIKEAVADTYALTLTYIHTL